MAQPSRWSTGRRRRRACRDAAVPRAGARRSRRARRAGPSLSRASSTLAPDPRRTDAGRCGRFQSKIAKTAWLRSRAAFYSPERRNFPRKTAKTSPLQTAGMSKRPLDDGRRGLNLLATAGKVNPRRLWRHDEIMFGRLEAAAAHCRPGRLEASGMWFRRPGDIRLRMPVRCISIVRRVDLRRHSAFETTLRVGQRPTALRSADRGRRVTGRFLFRNRRERRS